MMPIWVRCFAAAGVKHNLFSCSEVDQKMYYIVTVLSPTSAAQFRAYVQQWPYTMHLAAVLFNGERCGWVPEWTMPLLAAEAKVVAKLKEEGNRYERAISRGISGTRLGMRKRPIRRHYLGSSKLRRNSGAS